MKKLSVVVAVPDERPPRELLEAMAVQTLPPGDFEVVIVDVDGRSVQATRELVARAAA